MSQDNIFGDIVQSFINEITSPATQDAISALSGFRVGDLVHLKSGGMQMTVLREADEKNNVLVSWCAPARDSFGFGIGMGQNLHREVLPAAALVLVETK